MSNRTTKSFEATQFKPTPNNLEAFFMPFTSNRHFKGNPRLFVKAEGMHFTNIEGKKVLDATAGLWCVNAGHGRREISEAVAHQIQEMDYCPPFQMAHPAAFELASRVAALAPTGLDHVFFTNSGSESVDTALKIALAYQRAKGQGTRTRLIGRERGYHGVGFGGISVGGMVNNRKWFGTALGGVDHLPHTYNAKEMAFSKNQPAWGAHLADDLERLVALHDASSIAAVIVEPVAGSTGVLIPPKGYLEKLREICTKHVIDLRNVGLVGAIELESRPGKPGARAMDAFLKAYEKGMLIRVTGDIIAMSPPFIVEKSHIDQAVSIMADVLKSID